MSTFEKIASLLIVVLLLGILAFSAREFFEPEHENESLPAHSDFDDSRGQDFHIGPFMKIIDEQISGGTEDSCSLVQPVIIAALHDLDTRLKPVAASRGISEWSAFEINEPVLALLCNKNVAITLSDDQGNKLLITKMPFARKIPSGGVTADIGTMVRINATIISAGAAAAELPDASASLLIPDRFLDATSSTP